MNIRSLSGGFGAALAFGCPLAMAAESGEPLKLALGYTLVAAAEPGEHLNTPGLAAPVFVPSVPDSGFQLPPVVPESSPLEVPDTSVRQAYVSCAFTGNTVIDSKTLEGVCAGFLGRPIGEAEKEELRILLTKTYIDRGFVSSGVLIAKASPASDALAFEVIEGKLKSIRIGGLDGLNPDYVARRLALGTDEVLNVDTLRERYQLLLGDPLIAQLNARLVPEATLGEAAMEVQVQRAQPYHLQVFTNNYRPPSIGSQAFGISGSIRNLTGQGDSLDGSLQQGRNGSDGQRTSLGWRMPLNYSGTVFSLQLDHGTSSVVEEPLAVLGVRSKLDSNDIGLSQTLFDTLMHRLVVGFNRVERKNRTTLLGTPFSFTAGEPNGLTIAPASRVWQEYGYRTERQAVTLRSTFSFVQNNLQQIQGLPPATQPDQRYRTWLGQLQYARQVMDNGALVTLRGSAQQTSNHVLALDGMAVGGLMTVRGFRENQLVRDTGRVLNLEFSYPAIRNTESGTTMDLIPFYDQGQAANTGDVTAKLASLGLAMRFILRELTLDLALAKRLAKPDSVTNQGGTLQDRGIHLQIAYKFL